MFVSLFKYSSYSFILECAWQYLHFGCDINGTSFPGIDDNDTMKVFGKGGADVERNKPGDLYVTIKVWFLFFFQNTNSLCQFDQFFANELCIHFPSTDQRGSCLP